MERECREKEMRGGLQKQVAITLAEQIRLKLESEDEEKAIVEEEKKEMHVLWANAEQEAKELVEREKAVAKQERKKVDEFKAVLEAEAAKEEAREKLMDKQFVGGTSIIGEIILCMLMDSGSIRGHHPAGAPGCLRHAQFFVL